MKQSYFVRNLAISLLGLILLIFGASAYPVKAQVEDTLTPTETETPSPTPEPPNLTAIKNYQFTDDGNKNGSIDPGERITYTIQVVNNSTTAVDLILRDQLNWDYFEKILENNSENCYITGEFIECMLGQVGSSEVSYTVKLRDFVDFRGDDNLEVINGVTVFFEATPWATANAQFWVNAPTSTPTPTETLTPSPTITLAPTATPVPAPTATPPPPPGAPALEKTPVSIFTVAILAIIGIAVFTYVGGKENPSADKDITVARVSMFREGIIIIFIVSAVLLMGIAGTLTSDGVISILSAIVGYVFGRASAGR